MIPESPNTRLAAFLGLFIPIVALAQTPSSSELLTQLRHRDPGQRREAAQALGAMGAKAEFAALHLAKALKDADADVSISAAHALGDIGPSARQAIPALVAALSDQRKASWGSIPEGSPSVRDAAWYALHGIGADAAPAAAPYLESKSADDRCMAMWVISTCGPRAKPYLKHLLAALHDDNVDVRASAVEALGELAIRPEETVPALQRLLAVEDVDLRIQVVLALSRFGPKAEPSLPQLVELLRHENSTLRGFVAYALGELGASAAPALPHLRNLLVDESPVFNNHLPDRGFADSVSGWARAAVERIEKAAEASCGGT